MSCIRIERVARGGFEVSVDDPKIVKANQGDGSYKNPTQEYMFNTFDQVTEFLTKIVDQALPADEYSSTFDKAAEEVLDD